MSAVPPGAPARPGQGDATPERQGVARLVVRGLCKSYGPTRALAGVNFDVHAGEVHALVGENGAGKSTLMKALSGALLPDAGTVELEGRPYRPASPLDAAGSGVAMVYQELSLVPHLGAAENILLGREPTAWRLLDRAAMRAAARSAMATLGHGEIDVDSPVRRLPIAVQQLVEIARAISRPHTRVLILDEPTSSLARSDVERLFGTIRRLRAEGLSIIYISHVLEEVAAVADRVTVLRDGATVASGPVADFPARTVISLMAGRDLTELFPRSRRQPGDVVLEVRDLAGTDRPLSASFDLRAGEVLGIGGLVGAGRTELLRTIFGLAPVRRGGVRVRAIAGPASPWRRLEQGVGLLSEDRKIEGLALGMSVADNLTLSRLSGLGPPGFVLPRRQAAAAATWIARLGIRATSPLQQVGNLSGGNQQKVALGRLLHHDVDVLLLDEPTRGIDVTSKAQVYELIDRLALEGKAVLVVSSYLPELLGLCDRVAVMTRGRLGPARPAAGLTEHEVLTEAMGQS
jgi:ribose transport system ATP-binding protein